MVGGLGVSVVVGGLGDSVVVEVVVSIVVGGGKVVSSSVSSRFSKSIPVTSLNQPRNGPGRMNAANERF